MLKQKLTLKQQQKLSPQQIQLMKLVQLPTQSLEQRIKQEIEENPALEEGSNQEEYDEFDEFQNQDEYEDNQEDYIDAEDINIDEYLSDDDVPNYKTYSNNYSDDDEDKSVPHAASISFHSYLISQLHTQRLSDENYLIADFLVGNLDDDGYLRIELKKIVDDLTFTQGIYTDEDTLKYLLINHIQKLDPSGVGARNLQECLLIQLRNKSEKPARELAIEIIESHFDSFVKKHYDKILQKLGINENQLKEAITEIEKLNPRPGNAYNNNSKSTEVIIPDFTLRIVDGELDLTLNSRNAPELHVSNSFAEMLETYKDTEQKSSEQKKAVLFIKQKLDSAKWFIDAIKQRQNTLITTMSAIVEYQKEYFLTGDETKLKPMILKDIADIIGLDISTVSRVANSKYISTPYGSFLIKDFFSESMTNQDGEEVSTREIKSILQQIIKEENKRKPLTDEKLMHMLKEKGYNIARRTVAKYREQLNIPVARLRKEL